MFIWARHLDVPVVGPGSSSTQLPISFHLPKAFRYANRKTPLPFTTDTDVIIQEGLQNAGVDISLLNLDLSSVFSKPSKNPELLTREILIGFSTLAVAVFSAIPVAGEIFIASAASTLIPDAIGAAGGVAAAAVGNGAGFFATLLAGA